MMELLAVNLIFCAINGAFCIWGHPRWKPLNLIACVMCAVSVTLLIYTRYY